MSVGLNGRVRSRVGKSSNTPDKVNKGSRWWERLSARRRVALGVGAVGSCVLALSVSHCTSALSMVTGASWPMACLLAVGVDCGLVACECATTTSAPKLWPSEWTAGSFARGYVVGAVILSSILNSLASGVHASPGYELLGYAVGAVIPLLVLVLGCVASRLWTEG